MSSLNAAMYALNGLRVSCLSQPLMIGKETAAEITAIMDMLENAGKPAPDRTVDDSWRDQVGQQIAELENTQRAQAEQMQVIELAYRQLRERAEFMLDSAFSAATVTPATINPPPEMVPPEMVQASEPAPFPRAQTQALHAAALMAVSTLQAVLNQANPGQVSRLLRDQVREAIRQLHTTSEALISLPGGAILETPKFYPENVSSGVPGMRPDPVEFARSQELANIIHLLWNSGQVVGETHTAWVIDQVARMALGEDYPAWIMKYVGDCQECELHPSDCVCKGGPQIDSWETGIAP